MDERLKRITCVPGMMGGKPCIRGIRVTVATVLSLLASGESRERILESYPYLVADDFDAVLVYAASILRGPETDLDQFFAEKV